MLKSVWMVSALVVTLWGASALAADRPAGKELPGQTIEIKLEPQAWQTRRAETANVIGAIEASKGKNKAAMDRFDAILTAFEKDPVSITPMEAMDLYAVFYVPNESDKNMAGVLQMVSAFAVLGWYDSLRFADESGRAEIINNERFFNRAFTISGEATTKKLMDYLHKHPK
ncbi:MAG: hypothetical protein HY055_01505 [Magnetospirillum sp.]|nr:hypothetical protein [Magnetospirillum sp.]